MDITTLIGLVAVLSCITGAVATWIILGGELHTKNVTINVQARMIADLLISQTETHGPAQLPSTLSYYDTATNTWINLGDAADAVVSDQAMDRHLTVYGWADNGVRKLPREDALERDVATVTKIPGYTGIELDCL